VFLGLAGCPGGLQIDDDDDSGEGGSGRACTALPAAEQNGAGPAQLLDEAVFQERPEDLGIDRESIEYQELELDGELVHVLRFDVTTFHDRFGADWIHPVIVAAPAAPRLAATDVATLSAGTGTLNPIGPDDPDPIYGVEHPPWFLGSDTTENLLASYATATSALGVPLVATNIVAATVELDADTVAAIQAVAAQTTDPCDDEVCAGVLSADDKKLDCLQRAALATGDLTFDPFLNWGVAQMRIIDAAEAVLEAAYEELGTPVDLDWGRLWTLGSSKRGHAQPIAAALDGRIRGLVVSAADVSNFPAFAAQQLAVWEGGYSFGAPYYGQLADPDVHEAWLRAFDPFRWAPEVLADRTYVLAVGARDHLYPIGASLTYADALPDDTRFLLIPDYGHGWGAVDHLAAFRAMIASDLADAPWPTLDAAWDVDADRVTATVDGGEVASVDLWCSTEQGASNPMVKDIGPDCESAPMEPTDSPDLRHAAWTRSPMEDLGGGQYAADVPPSALSYPACFVRAATTSGTPITSPPLLSAPLCEAADLPLL
jgi:hypothetical protein